MLADIKMSLDKSKNIIPFLGGYFLHIMLIEKTPYNMHTHSSLLATKVLGFFFFHTVSDLNMVFGPNVTQLASNSTLLCIVSIKEWKTKLP